MECTSILINVLNVQPNQLMLDISCCLEVQPALMDSPPHSWREENLEANYVASLGQWRGAIFVGINDLKKEIILVIGSRIIIELVFSHRQRKCASEFISR